MPFKNTEEILSRASSDFENMALEIFQWQSRHCPPYKKFISLLGKAPNEITTVERIPFLPIEFFKSEKVLADNAQRETIFTSSGTTGMEVSKHYVADLSLYELSFRRAFETQYGKPEDWVILALLPSYLERSGSSLVYMCDQLIKSSHTELSGFFMHNHEQLLSHLHKAQSLGLKTMLIGVSFALLDFVQRFQLHFPELVVMETGGMKGTRKELTRDELHRELKSGFGVHSIHSEYGMTELLSQAYSTGSGLFTCPPWMRVLIRDSEDPMSLLTPPQSGGINVIDLANVHSCAFIATQDLGRKYADGSFEVLGRFDHSDVRGCNLLAL